VGLGWPLDQVETIAIDWAVRRRGAFGFKVKGGLPSTSAGNVLSFLQLRQRPVTTPSVAIRSHQWAEHGETAAVTARRQSAGSADLG
jgi:hypothetical protein